MTEYPFRNVDIAEIDEFKKTLNSSLPNEPYTSNECIALKKYIHTQRYGSLPRDGEVDINNNIQLRSIFEITNRIKDLEVSGYEIYFVTIMYKRNNKKANLRICMNMKKTNKIYMSLHDKMMINLFGKNYKKNSNHKQKIHSFAFIDSRYNLDEKIDQNKSNMYFNYELHHHAIFAVDKTIKNKFETYMNQKELNFGENEVQRVHIIKGKPHMTVYATKKHKKYIETTINVINK